MILTESALPSFVVYLLNKPLTKDRPALQQLEARHWSRDETAGDQLVRNDQSSLEQSTMVGGGVGGVGGGSLMAYAPPGVMGMVEHK